MSVEIAWGRGRTAARRAAVGGGRRGRARRAAPPTPVRGLAGGRRPGRGGRSFSGKRRPGAGGPRRSPGEVPLREPGPESLGATRSAGPRGKPSREAPPQGQWASARKVLGVAGPSPPLDSGASSPRRSRICSVTSRKRPGCLAAHPVPHAGAGCRVRCPGPPGAGVGGVRSVPLLPAARTPGCPLGQAKPKL